MTHPNVEVLYWTNVMTIEEKRMIERSGDFGRYILRQGYHTLADKMTKEAAVTWTTEEREFGAEGPAYIDEGNARTYGAIGVVRDRDETARYAVQLLQMRETALAEAEKVLEGLLDSFTGKADEDYASLRAAHREMKKKRLKAVEPGMWRPMWTERNHARRDRNEYLYADGAVRHEPYWRAPRVMPLEAVFESDVSATSEMVVDDQQAVAWRPAQR